MPFQSLTEEEVSRFVQPGCTSPDHLVKDIQSVKETCKYICPVCGSAQIIRVRNFPSDDNVLCVERHVWRQSHRPVEWEYVEQVDEWLNK